MPGVAAQIRFRGTMQRDDGIHDRRSAGRRWFATWLMTGCRIPQRARRSGQRRYSTLQLYPAGGGRLEPARWFGSDNSSSRQFQIPAAAIADSGSDKSAMAGGGGD
jgi:hypothetical protein